MKTRIVRIGNSRGVRIPKPLIDQAGLTDEVEIEIQGKSLVIRASERPRAGWAEAARKLHEDKGDELLDAPTPTRFDEDEWRW
jgi:antitoxin MazE